jgi:hypothetical protein
VDAKKNRLGPKDAMELLRDADELYAAKGARVVHVNRNREPWDPGSLKSLVLGPTGNLRAPTLRVGRTLVVGFDADTYRAVFKV